MKKPLIGPCGSFVAHGTCGVTTAVEYVMSFFGCCAEAGNSSSVIARIRRQINLFMLVLSQSHPQVTESPLYSVQGFVIRLVGNCNTDSCRWKDVVDRGLG